MLTIDLTSSSKTIIVAVLLGAAFFSNGSQALASLDDSNRPVCSFTRQLEDPYEKVKFQAEVAVARKASSSMYGDMFTDSTRVVYSGGEKVEMDSFSFNCVSCHDGTNASAHDIRYKNTSQLDAVAGGSPLSSHPIGMHYGSASYVNNQLRNVNSLNPAMLFVDGKVGCLSCHNPLNPERNHLVTSNEGSNLCFSCHIK